MFNPVENQLVVRSNLKDVTNIPKDRKVSVTEGETFEWFGRRRRPTHHPLLGESSSSSFLILAIFSGFSLSIFGTRPTMEAS